MAPVGREGWEFTLQGGTGLSFFFGDQVADPAFGFAASRFLSDSMQVEAQLLGVPGSKREQWWENRDRDEVISTGWSRSRRRMYIALTRVNLHLGEGRVRPYLSFGAGLGWGSEQLESSSRCFTSRCDPDPQVHTHDHQAIALATLLGSGIDFQLSDRWRLRPEAVMPVLWGAPQPGFVTLTIGITYTSRPTGPAGSAPSRPRPAAGEAPDSAWRRVTTIPLGDPVRVQVSRGTSALRDGEFARAASRILVASFVAADASALELRVAQGAEAGTWRIPRALVERVERVRIERDGPWEGVLGGFVVGAGIGAFGYLTSGGGDDSEIWIPVGTVLFGGPAALLGALGDWAHRSAEATEEIYDVRLVGRDGYSSRSRAR